MVDFKRDFILLLLGSDQTLEYQKDFYLFRFSNSHITFKLS